MGEVTAFLEFFQVVTDFVTNIDHSFSTGSEPVTDCPGHLTLLTEPTKTLRPFCIRRSQM